MTLVHYDLQTRFQISPSIVNVLVVEPEHVFARYVEQLQNAIGAGDSLFRLYEGENSVKMGKCCMLVTDLFAMELEQKKIVGKLYEDLRGIVERNFELDFARIKGDFCLLLDRVNAECHCEIEYEEGMDVRDLFKAFGVKLISEKASLLERIVSLLKVSAKYLSVRCFFLVNLKCFLSERELNLLYKEAELEQVSLFLLENSLKPKQETEKICLVDRDLCEMLVNE